MHQDLLKTMKCQYCGTDLNIKKIYRENKEGIIHGLIKCECNEYPILEGILILKNTATKKYVINHIKNNEIEKALKSLFGGYIYHIYRVIKIIESKPFGKIFEKILLSIANNSFNRKYIKYSNKEVPFSDVLGNAPYDVYLRHRFSSQTFWCLYPFIKLLRKKQKRILDLGCGTGHGSFLISNYVTPDELICVDGDFRNLYLAKKYFSNAEFINIDANYQLPFKDGTFSSVLVMDAFHYVDTRALLANELERVLDKKGMLLLLHLHNSLVDNVAAGKPLSPTTWQGLFTDNDVMSLPEISIIEDFVLRDRLDLSKKYSEAQLNSSNAILLIEGADLDCYEGIWKEILEIKDNLIINPIYKMKEVDNMILLEREFPSEYFRKEYPLTEKYLPEKCIIDKKYVNGRSVCLSDLNKIEIENLMRKFVIINVPENYLI